MIQQIQFVVHKFLQTCGRAFQSCILKQGIALNTFWKHVITWFVEVGLKYIQIL